MLQKAVAHYESAGRKQALADFSAKKHPFVDRELYVLCIGPDHLISANGNFPQYVGASADALRDAARKPLGAAILDAASSKGDGSVQYMLTNPTSGKLEPKITFVQKVGDDVCGLVSTTRNDWPFTSVDCHAGIPHNALEWMTMPLSYLARET